jgi:hypothetical protein
VATGNDFDYADAWRPDEGDVLTGEVVEITQYDGGGYGAYPICTVKTDDGEQLAAHAFHTVLRNELARLDAQPGMRISILYRGKQQKKDGSGTYESYRAKDLDQAAKRFDWSGERAAALEGPTPDDVAPRRRRRLASPGGREGGGDPLLRREADERDEVLS